VTVLSSPAQGAVLALTFQVAVALDLVGVGVATSLARNASVDYDASAAATARLAAKVSGVVLLIGAAATAVTPALLWLLGAGYEPGQGALIVGALVLASALRPRYDLWSALLRARQRVAPVIAANGAWIVVVVRGCVVLVPSLGATGAALSLLIGAGVLALVGTVAPGRLPYPDRTRGGGHAVHRGGTA
jgi:O-antigen/teichoic acid export membrane protein